MITERRSDPALHLLQPVRMMTNVAGKSPSEQDESRFTLKDGRTVFLRSIRHTDGDLLVEMFKKMSSQSLFLRFMWRISALPEDMVYRLTHVDYQKEYALVAVTPEEGKEAIIAVGRYAYDPGEDITDLAVAVRDDWQDLGIGKSLLAMTVAVARANGISHFRSMMSAENRRMKRILSELGYDVKYSWRSGFLEVDIISTQTGK